MFEESLVESTALLQTRNRWPALASFAAQAVVALVIIALPILHPELLPMRAPALALTPPPPPRPPQPPPPMQHIRTALAATNAPALPSMQTAHTALIRTLLPTPAVSDNPPISIGVGPVMPGNSAAALNFTERLGVGTVVSVAPPAHAGPINVSAGVTAGLLLAPIRPEYPAIAKAAGVQGTVVIHAIISRSGEIERAQAVSGPVMLQSAALEAVKRARYHPYLLNGQPTEVDTTVTVNFRMSS